MVDKDGIAVVGVGCKFPGANNVKEYWNLLKNGENHVKEVPPDRWNIDAYYDPDRNKPGKTYVRTAGFLSSIDEWDHRFYGINDMEAELIDPQQRIVLDCVHMALEDGGFTRKSIDGSNTGVYIGSMTDDYKNFVMDDSSISSTYSVTGTHNSVISARVSYTYNLSGPSMTLDTACSSSLVAIDVASQALTTGKCTMCICGGVNILMDPQLFVALSKAGMLSPTGQCKTFTKDADGYARGEGCGIVILKTLKDAINDGNKIWGTVKTGTNQDGHMISPITAPSGLQQERLIKDIFDRYGVEKRRIRVIEAHGTGTAIGDPTEVSALGTHFGKNANASNEVFIGSVKTNIGHLEAAAGVAGLIKVLLMMKYDMVVPSLWYNKENENPLIKLSKYGFVVPTKCTPWKKLKNENLIACVNSFGFGGTNAHCIVEKYMKMEGQEKNIKSCVPFIITISAHSKESLITNVQHMHDELKLQAYDISAVSYTSTCRRDHRPHRKAIFGKSQDDIIADAATFLDTGENFFTSIDSKKVVFVFCGVGTTWVGMCRLLMNMEVFKEAVLGIDKHLRPLSGWMISSKLVDSDDVMSNPLVSHIAIFACQIGLAALWQDLGIMPDVVVGQSVGEVAAAYVAGFLDLETAVRIIFYRSKLLSTVKPGRMTVIRNVEIDVVKKCCDSNDLVTIAVYSSPESCTVSGMAEDINNLKQKLSNMESVTPQMLDIDVQCAYHSPYVEQAAKEIEKHLQNIRYCEGHTPMISTVTGKVLTNGLVGTGRYWGENVKLPVLFSDAIKAANSETGYSIFLEIGPSPVLRAHIKNILVGNNNNYTSIPSIQKGNEMKTFTEALCALYELGMNPQWSKLFPHRRYFTDIPTYQFSKFKNLYQSQSSVRKNQGIDTSKTEHLYVKQLPKKDDRSHFKVEINEKSTPFVFQHIVTGVIILPGAVYADIGFEIGSNVLGLPNNRILLSLEFMRPVKVNTGTKTTLHISTIVQRNELLFHAKQNHVTMCKGWIRSAGQSMESNGKFDIECVKLSIANRGCKHMSEDEMYANLESIGFRYGPYFRLMKTSISNGTETLTETEVPEEIIDQYELTTLHPCVLDAMMQSTILTTTDEILVRIKNEKLSFLPVAIGELRVLGKPEKKMYIFTKRINTTVLDSVLQVHYNMLLLSQTGLILADLRNYTTYGKRNASMAPCELNYRLTWHPFQNEITSDKQPTNVLILTNIPSKDVNLEFEEFNNLVLCQNEVNLSNEEFIVNAFKHASINRDLHAVVMLVGIYDMDKTDLNVISAGEIHERVKCNCLFLAALVRYMTNENIAIPLYVTTQNTQPAFSNEMISINIVGEELWGFTRSIHLEFIHGEITLIDLQPSLVETKHTFVSFIEGTCHSIRSTKPEIIIHRDKIYGAQFTKVAKREIIPKLRLGERVLRQNESTYKIIADRSERITSLVLTHFDENEESSKNEYTYLRIKSVSLHPPLFYPRTTSGINLDQDIWIESLNDGHNLFGLEYTGLPINGTTNGRISCRKPEIDVMDNDDSCNKWEILAIFPSEISTKMSVPRDCTVHLKEIPFYQPGLILTTVLSWNLSKYVSKQSSVLVYSSRASSVSKLILEGLLRSQRKAYLVDLSGIQDKNTPTIDILITIEKIDLGFPLLGRCKTIICLHESMSEHLRLKLSRSAEQKLSTFSAKELLERRNVSRCLPKVVSWLQKNFKNLRNTEFQLSEARDDVLGIPFLSIDIMKDNKVVLPIRNPIEKLFNKTAIYIVTGGLTGLGWEIVVILAEMGAGIIASISRTDRSTDKADDIDKVEKHTGCKIINVKGDVSDLESMHNAIREIKSYTKNGYIRGVFHGAGVLNSKLLMNLEESQLDSVLRPKVIGTMNMHIVTSDLDLDFFVVHSSINSLVGSPGQSSYGAANSFLDTFMEWRRRQGLPGQAINWGALCVGMASRPEFVDNFTKRGFNLLSVLELRCCFQDALMRNATNIVYANINWDISAKDYTNPNLERVRLQMSILIEQTVSHSMHFDNDGLDDMSFDVKALRNVGTERQLLTITQVIQTISRKVIGGDQIQISMTNTLADMAFDSMSTVTFINIVHDITGYRIPPAFMLNMDNTLNDVVELLFNELFTNNAGEMDHTKGLNVTTTHGLPEIEPSKDSSMTPIKM